MSGHKQSNKFLHVTLVVAALGLLLSATPANAVKPGASHRTGSGGANENTQMRYNKNRNGNMDQPNTSPDQGVNGKVPTTSSGGGGGGGGGGMAGDASGGKEHQDPASQVKQHSSYNCTSSAPACGNPVMHRSFAGGLASGGGGGGGGGGMSSPLYAGGDYEWETWDRNESGGGGWTGVPNSEPYQSTITPTANLDPISEGFMKIQEEAMGMGGDKKPVGEKLLSNSLAGAGQNVAKMQQNKAASTPGQTGGEAKSNQNAEKCQGADNLALMERYHAAAAIEFVAEYVENFTTNGGNKWNKVRDEIFLPMAFLLLLPGAALCQVKSIVGAGMPVLGEVSPFEGIFRSIIGVFLIPATYLVVNYGIDVANSLTKTIADGYHNAFGTSMYDDAFCGHIRAFPVREPDENPGMIMNMKTVMFNYFGSTPMARLEGKTLAIKYYDPCAKIYIVPPDRGNEVVPYYVNEQRMAWNQANAALTMAWTILCCVQQAYLYYLFFVGPVMAALWVYPAKQLRDAFPNWCEGVVIVCFWSFFWSTSILLMAICRGVDDTGTIMFTALNTLVIASAKFAFDFVGMTKEMGQQAMRMSEKAAAAMAAAQKQNAGGGGGDKGGGGEKGGGNPKGDGKTADSGTTNPTGTSNPTPMHTSPVVATSGTSGTSSTSSTSGTGTGNTTDSASMSPTNVSLPPLENAMRAGSLAAHATGNPMAGFALAGLATALPWLAGGSGSSPSAAAIASAPGNLALYGADGADGNSTDLPLGYEAANAGITGTPGVGGNPLGAPAIESHMATLAAQQAAAQRAAGEGPAGQAAKEKLAQDQHKEMARVAQEAHQQEMKHAIAAGATPAQQDALHKRQEQQLAVAQAALTEQQRAIAMQGNGDQQMLAAANHNAHHYDHSQEFNMASVSADPSSATGLTGTGNGTTTTVAAGSVSPDGIPLTSSPVTTSGFALAAAGEISGAAPMPPLTVTDTTTAGYVNSNLNIDTSNPNFTSVATNNTFNDPSNGVGGFTAANQVLGKEIDPTVRSAVNDIAGAISGVSSTGVLAGYVDPSQAAPRVIDPNMVASSGTGTQQTYSQQAIDLTSSAAGAAAGAGLFASVQNPSSNPGTNLGDLVGKEVASRHEQFQENLMRAGEQDGRNAVAGPVTNPYEALTGTSLGSNNSVLASNAAPADTGYASPAAPSYSSPTPGNIFNTGGSLLGPESSSPSLAKNGMSAEVSDTVNSIADSISGINKDGYIQGTDPNLLSGSRSADSSGNVVSTGYGSNGESVGYAAGNTVGSYSGYDAPQPPASQPAPYQAPAEQPTYVASTNYAEASSPDASLSEAVGREIGDRYTTYEENLMKAAEADGRASVGGPVTSPYESMTGIPMASGSTSGGVPTHTSEGSLDKSQGWTLRNDVPGSGDKPSGFGSGPNPWMTDGSTVRPPLPQTAPPPIPVPAAEVRQYLIDKLGKQTKGVGTGSNGERKAVPNGGNKPVIKPVNARGGSAPPTGSGTKAEKPPASDWTSSLAMENLKRRARTIKKQNHDQQSADLEALKKMQEGSGDWSV